MRTHIYTAIGYLVFCTLSGLVCVGVGIGKLLHHELGSGLWNVAWGSFFTVAGIRWARQELRSERAPHRDDTTHWPPQQGDVWRDDQGEMWFAIEELHGRPGIDTWLCAPRLDDELQEPDGVRESRRLLTLVYREGDAS